MTHSHRICAFKTSSRPTLRLGTRGSELARIQAMGVARHLDEVGFSVELTIIRTAGDRSNAPVFSAIGTQGVFVREIERALVEHRVDLAVHSFKDLPTSSPEELTLGAVPTRFDAADVLIGRADAFDQRGSTWLPLPPHAQVGTASARRRVWLEHFRPDLEISPLRGNVLTRIRRLREGPLTAIVLAAAGLDRLRATGHLDEALEGLAVRRLDPERFVPAPAQGALAVQSRRDHAAIRDALGTLDDPSSRAAVEAERAVLARFEGGCDAAFGAYCRPAESGYELIAMLQRGGEVRSHRVRGPEPSILATQLWTELEAR